MSNFVIVTDSACDLPMNMVEELGIHVVPLAFILENETYWDYPDKRGMSTEEFYRKIAGGAMPTTNAVNVGQATDTIEPLLKEGKDVLVLAFSSGLSTTYNSFQIAVDELAEQYPERKVYAVDTLCAALGQGLLTYLAVEQQRAGKSIDEVRDWVEENKLHLCHWVAVDDLFHLKRGGRVSAATAVVGSMLQIKPIIHVDNEGHLVNVGKVRGRKAALKTLVDKVGELGVEPEKQVMYICHSACLADAQQVAEELRAAYSPKDIMIGDIGPVIGSHTGIGVVAVFFLGRER